MATTKTPTKTAKRTNSNKAKSRVGTNKLAPKKGFKLWMAALVVVLVAVAGYMIVNLSEASSYAFHRSGRNIIGGATVPRNKKDGSDGYVKYIQSGVFAYIYASKSQLSRSSQVCVEFVPQTGYVKMTLEIGNTGRKADKVAHRGSYAVANYVCAPARYGKPYQVQNIIKVTATNGNAYVQRIYGTR